MSNKLPPKWVLASASKHRQRQLLSAGHSIQAVPSDVPEDLWPNEVPSDRAQRLAQDKARAVAKACPDALVIGSDQVAHVQGRILRKPGHIDAALEQLMASQGRSVHFETALHLCHPNGEHYSEVVTTEIEFLAFDAETARRYLLLEQPFDAAGSFYSEAIGQWLIKAHRSDDPSAIIGLPMLALGRGLRHFGLDPLPPAPTA